MDITDIDGQYFIENLRPGKYLVLAIKCGYKPQVKIAMVKEGETTIVNFELIKPKTQEITTYNEILSEIIEAQKEFEIQGLSINPEFEASIISFIIQQNLEELPFIESQEPITLILKTQNSKLKTQNLSFNDELVIDIQADNPENLAGIDLKLDYDQTKLRLENPSSLIMIRSSTRLIFKAISEDCDTTIRIIPVSARNINNREIQATGCEITITTNIPETILLQSYPNPANDACYIPFKLSQNSNVSLEIYNILGQKVRTIEVG